ncbi:hypothetical protein F5Y13DRAFT_153562 [Hypoxylon sp. FL1857]|nr:hypothetical protein F5Y13DRAFT_153562 [Hypoxylon sp. FL1857]
MPPMGNILSSEVSARRCIKHGTFEMVMEMEGREARIDDILSNSSYINFLTPLRLGPLNVIQQERLRALLKRAMSHCDRIADIAANKPCEPIAHQWYQQLKARRLEVFNLPLGFRLRDPSTNLGARPLQLEYIKTLSAEDAAMVSYLLAALAGGFCQATVDLAAADPLFPERLIVFKESVLRHGSWFAWGYIHGGEAWKKMMVAIIYVGMIELTSFELGVVEEDDEDGTMPPSLQAGLLARFNELYPSDSEHGTQLYDVVKRLVKGTRVEDESGAGDAEGDAEGDENQE